MIFLGPFILLSPFIVYLIISLVKKEFNPLKWFKKDGDDVIIESIKFVSGADKESAISNYTEKIFMIVVIQKKITDVSRIDVIRKYGNKKQTITLKSDETEAVFEIDEDEDITEEQEITIDYTLKDKPVQFITNSETIKLENDQVETIESGETVNLKRNEEGELEVDIDPNIIITTNVNLTLVDVILQNDSNVNIFGTSNVYFNPYILDKNKFYIIRDGVKQGVSSEGNLQDDETSDYLFIITQFDIHKYISNENNTKILILDEGQLKMKDLSSMTTEEMKNSRIMLKFRKKNINNT